MTVLPPLRTHRYAPPPKHSPQRDHEYLTEGHEIARVARLMGRNLMPWQRHVVDIATEYKIVGPGESEDDLHLGHRHYKYTKVLITVPRQSGKTALTGPVRLHRMMTRPRISCFSTAQTGKDAGKRMKDLQELVSSSAIRGLFKPRLSQGSEGLTCKGNGSTVTRFAPGPAAIHGETPHWVDYDEIWKYTEELGDAMLGGVIPSQSTIKDDSQIWMLSTRGTAASVFMNKWVALGRGGRERGLAYFEWSMPEGMDPDEEATWWTFHPALGNTLTVEALRADMYSEGMTAAERLRGYMNILTESEDPIITTEAWAALAVEPEGMPRRQDLAISYEVAPNNERSAVMANWRDDAGMPCTRVLHSAPGSIWLVNYLRRIKANWDPAVIAADDGGPTRRITDVLTNPPADSNIPAMEIYTTGMRDFGTACESWLTMARDDKTLKHDGSKTLSNAVAHAVLRTTNGTTRIDRDKSTGPVCEAIASAVGLWAYDHPAVSIGMQVY